VLFRSRSPPMLSRRAPSSCHARSASPSDTLADALLRQQGEVVVRESIEERLRFTVAGQRRHARAPQVARTAHEAPRTPPPRRRAAAPPHPRWGLRTHEPTQQQRTSGENDVKIADSESFILFSRRMSTVPFIVLVPIEGGGGFEASGGQTGAAAGRRRRKLLAVIIARAACRSY
jgi:hypothetical protein